MLKTMALAASVLLLASASPGQAAGGLSPLPDPAVRLASGGCGPYGHRGYYGECRPNYPPRPVYRACPWGTHPTPWGCRRNW